MRHATCRSGGGAAGASGHWAGYAASRPRISAIPRPDTKSVATSRPSLSTVQLAQERQVDSSLPASRTAPVNWQHHTRPHRPRARPRRPFDLLWDPSPLVRLLLVRCSREHARPRRLVEARPADQQRGLPRTHRAWLPACPRRLLTRLAALRALQTALAGHHPALARPLHHPRSRRRLHPPMPLDRAIPGQRRRVVLRRKRQRRDERR